LQIRSDTFKIQAVEMTGGPRAINISTDGCFSSRAESANASRWDAGGGRARESQTSKRIQDLSFWGCVALQWSPDLAAPPGQTQEFRFATMPFYRCSGPSPKPGREPLDCPGSRRDFLSEDTSPALPSPAVLAQCNLCDFFDCFSQRAAAEGGEAHTTTTRTTVMTTVPASPPIFLEGFPATRGRPDPQKPTISGRSKNHVY